jgi:hypothetical protein
MTTADRQDRLARAVAVLRASNDLGARLAWASGRWLCDLRSQLAWAIDLVGDLARTDDGVLRTFADIPPWDGGERGIVDESGVAGRGSTPEWERGVIDESAVIVLHELSRRLYVVEPQIRRLGGPAEDFGEDEYDPVVELSRAEVARDYPGRPLASLTLGRFVLGAPDRDLCFFRSPWLGCAHLVAVDPRCIAWGSLVEGTHVEDCQCRLWRSARADSAAHGFGWSPLNRDGVLVDLTPGGFEAGRLRGPGPALTIRDEASGRDLDVVSYVLERPGQLPVRVVLGPSSDALLPALVGSVVQIVRRGDFAMGDGRLTRVYSAGRVTYLGSLW